MLEDPTTRANDVAATRPAADAVPVTAASARPEEAGRFAPGTILAQRYRVVSLLGRGGMGEVYRAEDMMVGETVALKFLPPELAADAYRVSRFRNEVRVARMVSHPNVCRVHDLAEADGRLLLSMQFIGGEDLSSLLRRIGRLPEDKALEIARQLCAGLQAAHDKGIIHRDLKPANIMIDANGEALITDFGLAGLADRIEDVGSGTPAYMSPEQRSGREVTARSDIYALGLVLHEIFTGKRRQQTGGAQETSGSLDPIVARVLDQCCEADPALRPASAAMVARALPGGDPLAAAMAAGRTPSPAMVAAAGEHTGLKPVVALALLGIALVSLLVTGWAMDRTLPVRAMSPEELRVRARDLMRQVRGSVAEYEHSGIAHDPGVSALGEDGDKLWIPHQFWLISSPVPLGTQRLSSTTEITPTNVRLDAPGTTLVLLDMTGKLLRYEAVWDPRAPVAGSGPDWDVWIDRSGVDRSRLTPVEVTPESAAWDYKDAAGHSYRIDGVAERGHVRVFRVRGEWEEPVGSPWPWRVESILATVAILFAIRNYRMGRADLRGALILALFVCVVLLAMNALRGADMLHWRTLVTPIDALSLPVLNALMFGTAYFAMEPYLRRRWPVVMVTWTRLLHGDWRSPTVGRDILVGLGVTAVLRIGITIGALWFLPMDYSSLEDLQNTPYFLAGIIESLAGALVRAVIMMFVLFVARMLFRRDWIAAGAVSVLLALLLLGRFGSFDPLAACLFLLVAAVQVWVAVRFGFLAVVASQVLVIDSEFVQTLDSAHWFAIYSYLAIGWVALIGLAAFWVATAGQRLLPDDAD